MRVGPRVTVPGTHCDYPIQLDFGEASDIVDLFDSLPFAVGDFVDRFYFEATQGGDYVVMATGMDEGAGHHGESVGE
jgi:hypothetical protein